MIKCNFSKGYKDICARCGDLQFFKGYKDICARCGNLQKDHLKRRYGLRLQDVEGHISTAWFPAKKQRNAYESGIHEMLAYVIRKDPAFKIAKCIEIKRVIKWSNS